jgi:exopolysaccharide biosynthesis polyprenyl glycosylphosphotransferase
LIRLLHAYFPARTFFLGISEACLVAAAFVAATIARLGTNDATIMINYEQGLGKILVVSMAFVACMYYFDMYDSFVLNNQREVLTRMIQMQGTVCIILAGIYYVYPPLELGRGIFLIGFILVAILLLVWRRLFFMWNTLPQFAERALILGDSPLASLLVAELRARPEFGIRVVGQLQNGENADGKLADISSEGQLESLLSSVKPYRPDRIIVGLSERRGKTPVEALLHLKSRGVKIQDACEVYEAVTGKVPIESVGLSQLLFSPGFQFSRPLVVYKRVASLVLSVLALILALPLMVLISLAIRLDSVGTVIFRQKRIGKGGKIFTLYKFRTMWNSAVPGDNHRPAEATDKRFTRIGKLLRRTRMDELPQLLNILRGDMHFIGPRPFVTEQEQEYAKKIPHYQQRWHVTPGATGWAQVNRGYNFSIEDNKEKLAYDLFYIKNFSIGLDILIFLKTIKILLLNRGSR